MKYNKWQWDNGLILTAFQLIWGYFMLRDWGIVYIVHLYLFLCSCERDFFLNILF